ncbi:drug/metabolite transporter (DMT)-like permease [Azospirillum sp. OGB3]|uniref:DMT family transporter n=1 Tax=Azospirillum sp. OGB3 TaxID=2587012 RepID=UPI001605C527|nr:DMT family transporter [Azospirillum sp. OGB3]MBB3265549.1 drug/metabolite transporter (DMT)-like permease [Azospirillum sp. OGB3]
MPTEALLAVLAGALLHAGWNTALKAGGGSRSDAVLVVAGSAFIALLLLPVLPPPSLASAPYLGVTTVLHVAYYRLLTAAYREGAMSHAYPLMRGTPPLIVALGSGLLLGESLSAGAWAGTVLVCGGILALTLLGRGSGSSGSWRGTACALANALVIAAYTVVDGIGVRLSGAPAGYTLWCFLLLSVPMVGGALLRDARGFLSHARRRWMVALGGGAASIASYGLALWAMTIAPVAVVAAVRETSILFAIALAALVLKERVGPVRLASGVVIVLGAASLRVAA